MIVVFAYSQNSSEHVQQDDKVPPAETIVPEPVECGTKGRL